MRMRVCLLMLCFLTVPTFLSAQAAKPKAEAVELEADLNVWTVKFEDSNPKTMTILGLVHRKGAGNSAPVKVGVEYTVNLRDGNATLGGEQRMLNKYLADLAMVNIQVLADYAATSIGFFHKSPEGSLAQIVSLTVQMDRLQIVGILKRKVGENEYQARPVTTYNLDLSRGVVTVAGMPPKPFDVAEVPIISGNLYAISMYAMYVLNEWHKPQTGNLANHPE